MVLSICNLFSADERLETGMFSNPLFRSEQKKRSTPLVACHLARKSGNFGLKSNGKVIFRKFHSEIEEYLQRNKKR